jgi:hypothetical protein
MNNKKHKNATKKGTKNVRHAKSVFKRTLASNASKTDKYKKELLEVDKQEDKYDKMFEQKLASQYKEFRNLKEHHMQTKKFLRILMVIITVIIIALLVLSYS